MRIKDTEIVGYDQINSQNLSLERRALYSGTLFCPKKPVHNKFFHHLSITKLDYVDGNGNKHWGDPVTTFTLLDDDIPFASLEELITYYNTGQSLRPLTHYGIDWEISSCGTVVKVKGKRLTVRKHRSKAQRLKHEVNRNNRTFNVRRLVALAWHGEPESPNMRVLLKDPADEDNIHYDNVYWSASSHTPDEIKECNQHLKQFNK